MVRERREGAGGLRLLLFSDLHGDASAARRVAERATQADVLVGAGDFAETRQLDRSAFAILRDLPRPLVLVPGNNESLEELRAACLGWRDTHILHGDAVTIAGQRFYGLGGGVPVTPFGAWSWDLGEEEAAALLAALAPGDVLVSHSPPQGCVDRSGSGVSHGSRAVREAVLRVRPRLTVCGHIHADGGKAADLDGCPVVNAGPDGLFWTLEGDGRPS